MFKIVSSKQFKKDLKQAQKRGFKIEALRKIVNTLAAGEKLETKYRDHDLRGEYQGFRECHIEPDWLLVYQIYGDLLELYLLRTGTHSDLF